MKSRANALVVTACGAISAIGDSAAQTCASIRAGFSGLQFLDDYLPLPPDVMVEAPEPVRVARALELAFNEATDERIAMLSSRAIADLVQGGGAGTIDRSLLEQSVLWLCLPEGLDGDSGAELAEAVQRGLGLFFADVRVNEGHAAPAFALRDIMNQAGHDSPPHVLLATDSWLGQQRLEWLDERYRLRGQRSADGFFPGEAAAALLLETAHAAERRGAIAVATVVAAGTATETATILGDLNSTGSGLTTAVRQVARADALPDWVISDLNGEAYRSHEWGLTATRLRWSPRAFWHPAEYTGDIGAASGALGIALACRALEESYAPGRECVVLSSSDNGGRGAIRIRGELQDI